MTYINLWLNAKGDDRKPKIKNILHSPIPFLRQILSPYRQVNLRPQCIFLPRSQGSVPELSPIRKENGQHHLLTNQVSE